MLELSVITVLMMFPEVSCILRRLEDWLII